MTDDLKRAWYRLPPSLRAGLFTLLVLGAVLVPVLFGRAKATSEPAYEPISFETLFGVDLSDPMEQDVDRDRDGLSLTAEARAGTDPFNQDSDEDGLRDGQDQDPLSRAVMYWGDPDLTSGDRYHYPGPAWWRGACRLGGDWGETGGWVSEAEERAESALYIELNRAVLAEDLVLDLDVWGVEGASLRVALLDGEGKTVVGDAFGNLLTRAQTHLQCRRSLPLRRFPHAGRRST